MKKNQCYKHVNNRSVFVEVLKLFYVPEKDVWKVRAMWWKWHSKPQFRFPMQIIQRFVVKKEDRHLWMPISNI